GLRLFLAPPCSLYRSPGSPCAVFFFFSLRLPPSPTLFPYTTLFRSTAGGRTRIGRAGPTARNPACPESTRRHAAAGDQARSNLGRGEDHRGHDPARRDLGSTFPGRTDPDRETAGRESHRVTQRPRSAAARQRHRTPGAGVAPRAGRATNGSTGMSDIRIQKTGEPDILKTSDGRLTLSVPIQIKRRSGRKLVTLPNGETAPVRPWDVAPTSIQLALARGHRWLAMLESGEAKSLKEIATREGIDNSYVSRMVNLTTLAPDIVAAILDDALPNHVTLFDLAVDPPALWDEQRERVWL